MKNYYDILGVDPLASHSEIRKAYRRKALDLHPDRFPHASQSVRRAAESSFKEVNEAYQVLGNQDRRREYHADWVRSSLPPKPVVKPSVIVFNDVSPGEVKTGSFVIRNDGGAYDSIWFSDPDSWLKVTDYASLELEDELPLRVDIEVSCASWGYHYGETIVVKLDGVEAEVKVQVHTKHAPVPNSAGTATATTQASGSGDWGVFAGAALLVAFIIMIFAANTPGNNGSAGNYNRPAVNQYPTGPSYTSGQPNYGGNLPGTGFIQPVFGVNQPGISGNQPSFGINQPTFGGNQPTFGGNQPTFGGNQPTFGGSQPTFGGSQPTFGGSQPTFGGSQPSFGGRQPSFGGRQPSFGGSRPSSGGRSSGFGGGSSGFGGGSSGFGGGGFSFGR